MKRFLNVYVVLFFLVGFAAGFFFGRMRCPAEKSPVRAVVHDTIRIGAPTLTEVRVVESPSVVDTVSVIQDYYTQKIYIDTIVPNPYVTIVLNDTVSLNRLDGQNLHVYTRLPEAKKSSISLFAETGYQTANLSLEYKYKRFGVFAGYNFALKTPVVGLKYQLIAW